MYAEPRIETVETLRLTGISTPTSFADDRTPVLWRTFMSLRDAIGGRIGSELYSVQVYPADFFARFDPTRPFTKWAAVATTGETTQGFERLTIPEGRYAVFPYKGHPAQAGAFFRWVFSQWLPASGYALDQRPHFEVLGAKFDKDSNDSEEDIYIPIRPKP